MKSSLKAYRKMHSAGMLWNMEQFPVDSYGVNTQNSLIKLAPLEKS